MICDVRCKFSAKETENESGSLETFLGSEFGFFYCRRQNKKIRMNDVNKMTFDSLVYTIMTSIYGAWKVYAKWVTGVSLGNITAEFKISYLVLKFSIYLEIENRY